VKRSCVEPEDDIDEPRKVQNGHCAVAADIAPAAGRESPAT
jgi:hypothetical protein